MNFWFSIWLGGDAVYLVKEEWKKRMMVCGEDDGFCSAHVEFGVPVTYQVHVMSRLFAGEEITLHNRQS